MSDLFEYYFRNDLCHLKYAKGPPSLLGREFHDYQEFILFIGGKARFISQNVQIDLTPGCVVAVPKEQFHQFVVDEPDTYTRCIVGFSDIPGMEKLINDVMKEIKVIANPSKTMLSTFEFLQKAFAENLSDEEKQQLIVASLVQMLTEQKYFAGKTVQKNNLLSDLTIRALGYIDANYAENLTLASIANELNVSPSSLSHRFRDDLNLSVYRYIVEKRISEVRQCVTKGISLSEAVTSCGFADYSCFFRLYKKYYNIKPSELLR